MHSLIRKVYFLFFSSKRIWISLITFVFLVVGCHGNDHNDAFMVIPEGNVVENYGYCCHEKQPCFVDENQTANFFWNKDSLILENTERPQDDDSIFLGGQSNIHNEILSSRNFSTRERVYKIRLSKVITNAAVLNQSAVVVRDEIWLSSSYEKGSSTKGQILKISLEDVLYGNGETIEKESLRRVFHSIGHGGVTSYSEQTDYLAGCTYGEGSSLQNVLVLVPRTKNGNVYPTNDGAVYIKLDSLIKDSKKNISFSFGEQPCIGYIFNGDYIIKVLLGIDANGKYDGSVKKIETFENFVYHRNSQQSIYQGGEIWRLVGTTGIFFEKWSLSGCESKLTFSSMIRLNGKGDGGDQEPEGICVADGKIIISSVKKNKEINLIVLEEYKTSF